MIVPCTSHISKDFDANGNPCSAKWNRDFSLWPVYQRWTFWLLHMILWFHMYRHTHTAYAVTLRLPCSSQCFLRNSLLKYNRVFLRGKTKQNKTKQTNKKDHPNHTSIFLLEVFCYYKHFLPKERFCYASMENKSFLSTE